MILMTERLLQTLAMILTGQPFRRIGAPVPRNHRTTSVKDIHLAQISAEQQSPETLALALKVLGTFDFSGAASTIAVTRLTSRSCAQ